MLVFILLEQRSGESRVVSVAETLENVQAEAVHDAEVLKYGPLGEWSDVPLAAVGMGVYHSKALGQSGAYYAIFEEELLG